MQDKQDMPNMRGWAKFSECEQYRYTLGRRWSPGGKRVCFCLLNPSTADAKVLDPTLTRCHRYALRWGFSAMDVSNIFALRSTDPKGLKLVDDPIGDQNDAAIVRLAKRADLVVVGHVANIEGDPRLSGDDQGAGVAGEVELAPRCAHGASPHGVDIVEASGGEGFAGVGD